jgi:hypothetical protein
MIRPVKTSYITLWIEDGIIMSVFGNIHVDLQVARHAIEKRLELTKGEVYPALADMRAIKDMDREAREYFANEGAKLLSARAIITGNVFTRTIAEVFMMINRPPIPTRLFSEYPEAKQWLQEYVGKG